ncbi:hypothetical protein SGCOL_004160 [Colletotrichum sp. CLE4]
MHILVIGATGRNGTLVLTEALSRNHTITALVRDPTTTTSLPSHKNLTLKKGTPLSLPDLLSAMQQTTTPPDAIIITLNPRRQSDSPFSALDPNTPPALLHDSVNNTLTAIKSLKSLNTPDWRPKLVINSMQGAGASAQSLILPLRALFNHTNMKHTLDDHNAVDTLIKGDAGNDAVDWVLVRPPMLIEGEKLPVKVYTDEGSGVCWMPKITRRSVAGFMVDAVEKDDWNRSAPVVTN